MSYLKGLLEFSQNGVFVGYPHFHGVADDTSQTVKSMQKGHNTMSQSFLTS